MERPVIRVNLIEDLDVIHKTIRDWIDSAEGMTCCGAYSNGEDAMESIPSDPPDLVIMDVGLPGMNGIECMVKLNLKCSGIRFLMFTIFDDGDNLFEALKADGYLLKHETEEKVIEAIREVMKGGAPMSRGIARKVLQSFRKSHPAELPLTPRQLDVLEMLSRGLMYKEIGEKLFIETGTVKQHINTIFKKLQVKSRTEAINKYPGREF